MKEVARKLKQKRKMGSGICLVVALVCLGMVGAEHGAYMDEFVVDIDGGQDVVDLVAASTGFQHIRKLEGMNIYVFTHPSVARRSKRSAVDLLEKLRSDPNVNQAEQQRVLTRDKRDQKRLRKKRKIVYDKQVELPIKVYKDKSVYQRFSPVRDGLGAKDFDDNPGCMHRFKDPNYPDQWYLCNEGQTGGERGLDTGAYKVWDKGITGRGIVVTVLDDGIERTHPDLRDNYDANASHDFNGNDDDPTPNEKYSDNSHGTRCAGEIAAKADNDVCGVGIAYGARIGGVRMLDGQISDALEASAVTYKMDYIDIYSASWGPADNGRTMEEPGLAMRKALETGTREGRNGLGNLYLWATGNGGMVGDNCGADGYVSDIHTLAVGCINDLSENAYFSEACPATFGSIYTGGASHPPGEDDYKAPNLKVTTTDVHGDCTLEFQGTSAAAPLAAGCFALVLEANYNITWRDAQHIVVVTARIPNAIEKEYTINGAGFHVNPHFGFGSLDCALMVQAAQGWTTVPEQHVCEAGSISPDEEVESHGSLVVTIDVDGCMEAEEEVNYLEHVVAKIKITATRRGFVDLVLVSPHGTKSEILRVRPQDDESIPIDFEFMTVHNWGENPHGVWSLIVTDASPRSFENKIVLKSWDLKLYGTADKPTYPEGSSQNQAVPSGGKNSGNDIEKVKDEKGENDAHSPSKNELKHDMHFEKVEADSVKISKMDRAVGWAMRMLKEDRLDSILDDDDENFHLQRLREIFNEADQRAQKKTVERGYRRNEFQRGKEEEEREKEEEKEREVDDQLEELIRALQDLLEKRK